MIVFLKFIMTFAIQHKPKIFKSSIPYRCDIHNFDNVTRKDVLDDVLGFMAGAVAAECLIKFLTFFNELEKKMLIENSLNLLN